MDGVNYTYNNAIPVADVKISIVQMQGSKMNSNRIKELVEQAGFYMTEKNGAALAEFAELIVKDCIRIGGPEDSYRDEWFNAKADSVNKIKIFFGVEE